MHLFNNNFDIFYKCFVKKDYALTPFDKVIFFSKYGFQLATSETEITPVNYGNGIIGAIHQNTLTLRNVNL